MNVSAWAVRNPVPVVLTFVLLLVGGQAISLAMRQRAHELGVNLRRSYGMTETAGSTRHERRRPDKIEEMLHISFHRNFSFI